ncbi:hypothetical protein ACFQJ5_04890 [Halomicroarcula sp. GCM10025324]|uniref:DUF7260 family protein n=1 Tax=Haloarcula TaxID=2237 RepID=UPI0023E86514|nr:hypothetical protein [Halomicroarcula sp. ZS-22-S1]
MPETTHPRIERALDVLDRERRLLTDERRAFRRFQRRLATIEPSPPSSPLAVASGGETVALSTGEPTPSDGLRAVRTAYRETVMATRHFDSEYDETLRQNVTAEFGADVATQIVDGHRLTPILHESLETGSQQAAQERTEFLRVLDRERESLCAIREALDECEREAHELSQAVTDADDSVELGRIDDRLTTLKRECTDLAGARQTRLHKRTVGSFSGIEGDSLVDFLYGEFEATCPGLAAITDCLASIQAIRQRCLR